jgi:predicted transcriptional regulator
MNDELPPTVQNTSLGELEALVLSALWEKERLSTPEAFNQVGIPRGLAYTTILPVLQRLHRKGLATRQAVGKSHVYAATLSRDQFAERRAEILAASMVKLGNAGLAAFLSEAGRLDPEFVAQLRAQLKGLES